MKKIIIISSVTILIFLGFFKFFYAKPSIISENSPLPSLALDKEEEKGESQTIIEINGIRYNTNYSANMSVYDHMNQLKDAGKINFSERNYTGMGKFIYEINGIKGNGTKNWIYYVNGVEAQVGVSNYKIKARDVISWKYE